MKKVSVSDIITNSSTEIFTLETDKSIEEVSRTLHEITSGFSEPEIMEKGKGVLEYLRSFGYIIDPDDKKQLANYRLHECILTDNCKVVWRKNQKGEWILETRYYKNRNIIKKAFIKYINHRKNILIKFYENQKFKHIRALANYFKVKTLKIDNWLPNHIDDYPEGFVEGFIKSYKGRKPKNWNLPEELDINYYIGKIGFQEEEENLIPYNDYDKILDEFGGDHWHMG